MRFLSILLVVSVARVSGSRLAAVPRLVSIPDAQRSDVVRVPQFLSDAEIASLHSTAEAVAEDVETHDLHRRQGAPERTWFTIFINHKLKELLPALHARMLQAAKTADDENWHVLDDDRYELNIRCAEYHRVMPGGGIPMKKHHDFGSLLTMDLMLSDPVGGDFRGGTFQTLEVDGELKSHSFERGDLLIFLSHKYHCVNPVSEGKRVVLVCELWEGLPRRCAKRCNEPWGACICEFRPPPVLYQPAATINGAQDAYLKLKPCLKYFSTSDADSNTLFANLGADPAASSDFAQLGAHRQWVRRKEADKAHTDALAQAKRLVAGESI